MTQRLPGREHPGTATIRFGGSDAPPRRPDGPTHRWWAVTVLLAGVLLAGTVAFLLGLLGIAVGAGIAIQHASKLGFTPMTAHRFGVPAQRDGPDGVRRLDGRQEGQLTSLGLVPGCHLSGTPARDGEDDGEF